MSGPEKTKTPNPEPGFGILEDADAEAPAAPWIRQTKEGDIPTESYNPWSSTPSEWNG